MSLGPPPPQPQPQLGGELPRALAPPTAARPLPSATPVSGHAHLRSGAPLLAAPGSALPPGRRGRCRIQGRGAAAGGGSEVAAPSGPRALPADVLRTVNYEKQRL